MLWRYLARGRLKQAGVGELGKKRSSDASQAHFVAGTRPARSG